MYKQRTIAEKIEFVGIGLHSGLEVRMEIFPAPADSGIVFVRSDLSPGVEIPARPEFVVDTQLATTLGREVNGQRVTIATVEHLLAALTGLGIDNLMIHVDGPELPVMDGSAAPFVKLILDAGIEEVRGPKRVMVIRKEVTVQDGEKLAKIAPGPGYEITCSLDFDHPLISTKPFVFNFSERNFRNDLCGARTFGFAQDVELLRQNGLALGGSLDNAVVIDGFEIMNPEGLRYADEFVRHKILDVIGDLSLIGMPVIGKVTMHCSGHAMNARLVNAVLSDSRAYEIVELNDSFQRDLRPAMGDLSFFESVNSLA